MHIGMLAPVEIGALSSYLDEEFQHKSNAEPSANAPAATALAIALLKRGHRVSMVTYSTNKAEYFARGERLEIRRVQGLRPRSEFVSGWRSPIRDMASSMLQSNPDVVHAHWTYEFALAARKTGIPTAVTVRDAPLTVLRYEPDLYRLGRYLMAVRFRLSRDRQRVALAAVSPYMAQKWKKQMMDRRHVHTLPNLPLVSDREPVVGEKAEFPLVVELASAVPRKNVIKLIEAFHLVRLAIPNAELYLLGHGLDDGSQISRYARDAGRADGVRFLGPLSRSESQTQLRKAWLHAHVALEESFGNTLIEAMRLGTAIIAGRRSGAVPWVLGDGEGGALVDVTDVDHIANAIIRLLKDDDERSRLESAGSDLLRSRHSEGAIIEQHLRLYDHLAQGRSA